MVRLPERARTVSSWTSTAPMGTSPASAEARASASASCIKWRSSGIRVHENSMGHGGMPYQTAGRENSPCANFSGVRGVLAVLEGFEFFEGARPVRTEKAGESAIGEYSSAGLAAGAVVRFVFGVPNAQNLFTTSRAGLTVAPVDGHAFAKGSYFFREAGGSFGAQAINPECKHRSRRGE